MYDIESIKLSISQCNEMNSWWNSVSAFDFVLTNAETLLLARWRKQFNRHAINIERGLDCISTNLISDMQ